MTLNVPDHVPPECVWDHDFAGFLGELDDPYLAGARLHDGPGIIWATNASYGIPSWIFTRHALIEEGFANRQIFSNLRGPVIAAALDPEWLMIPVESDPPQHRQYRDILRPFFTPQAIETRMDEVQGLCDSLIDGFVDRGQCEFIGEFASVLPNAIVISMLGMPRDMLEQFLEWEEISMRGADIAERHAAGVAIHDYLRDFIADQRKNPSNELMQSIISATIDDRAITGAEVLGIAFQLFTAGLDTVFSTLGWIMRYLASDQPLQSRLRNNPHEIRAAVEEFTRAFGVSAPARIVAEDMVFEGIPMKKGDNVLLPTFLAGRDFRAFPDPHIIDIDRKPKHVTFGSGAHVCLGIHLAKREMKIMIESFLARMTNIHIPEGTPFDYHTTSTIGVERLTLAWDPAEPGSRQTG